MSTNPEQLRQEALRGEQARRLLDDPILVEAIAQLKDTYLAAWAATKPEENAARERLHMAYTMVDEVNAHLRSVIGNGTVAAAQLAKLKTGK